MRMIRLIIILLIMSTNSLSITYHNKELDKLLLDVSYQYRSEKVRKVINSDKSYILILEDRRTKKFTRLLMISKK